MADNPKKRDRLSLSERRARGLVAPEDLSCTAMVGEVSLDEDAWTELEKRIKLRLGSDSRAALTRALNDLLENIALRKRNPLDARKVNHDLKRIDKYAKGLAELIGQDPGYAAQIAVHAVVGYDTSILRDILWRISTVARGSKFFKRGGRPLHNVERAFAKRVKQVWREAAKTKKHGAYWDAVANTFRGDVVEIVKTLHAAALAHIDSDSLAALPAILETLKRRKKKA